MSVVYDTMVLVVVVNAVHVNMRVNGENAAVVNGGMHQTCAELTHVGPDPAVFAKTVVTAVAGYSD